MASIQQMPLGVMKYLNNAKAMAKDIAMPKTRFVEGYSPYYQTPRTYYHYDMGPGYWRNTVNHYHHVGRSSSSKKKSENAVLPGILLAIGTGVMLYSLGAEYSKLLNAKEDLKKFERDKKFALLDLHQAGASQLKAYHFENITRIQNDILQTYKNDSETKLLIKGAVTTGCAMGTYVCAKALLHNQYITEASPTIGLISTALIVGGCFSWMFKSGLDSTSETMKRKAQDLIGAIQSFNSTSEAFAG